MNENTTGLLWTEETRSLVSPRRSHGVREPLPSDGAAAELVASILALRKSTLTAGVQHAGPAATLQQAVVDGAETVEAAAAAAVLLGAEPDSPLDRTTTDVVSAALVDAWIERHGAAFAVRACAETVLLGVRRRPVERALVLVRYQAMQVHDPQNEDVEQRWKALRQRVATMPDAAYAEARAAAATILETAPLRLAARIVYAFPDELAWSARHAQALLDQKQASLFRLVLRSLADRALIERIVEESDARISMLVPVIYDIADALGLEAETSLLAIANSGIFDIGYGFDAECRAVVAALGLLPTEGAAGWLLERFDDKLVRPGASALLARAPRLGIVALAKTVVGTPKKKDDVVRGLLESIVRSSPEAASAALERLEGPAQKLVADVIAKTVITATASASELPSLLVSPPWEKSVAGAGGKKKPTKKKQTLGLEPLPFPEEVVWSDVPKPGVPSVKSTSQDHQLKELEKKVKSGQGIAFWEIAELSDKAACEAFVQIRAESWHDWWLGRDLLAQLARFGVPAIGPCLRFAKKKPADVAFALEPAVSPRVAPVMAHVLARVKKARRHAERWLTRNPRAAAIGLVVELFGADADARARDNAARALRFVAARGHRAVIEEVARTYGQPVVTGVEAALSADSLAEGAPSKPPRLPEWFDVAMLPRPRLAGSKKALPIEAARRIAEMLAFTDADEPYAGLEVVRETCDAASLGDFVWGLFEAWSRAGFPMDEKWAFFAVGHFGRDEHAQRLTPMIRVWPTEGAFPRAVVGLDVLATMKSDVSLMLLHGISEKVKSRPLLNRAKEKVASVAESLGLTAEELADRLVPTLGLDDDGTRVLVLGPTRSFRVGFDETLRPFVHEVLGDAAARRSGGRLAELPKPNAQDDAELAASAHDEWKALKKTAKAVAVQQLQRFESAMIGRRRWEPESFASYLVGHPLVKQIVRRLVWGSYDSSDALGATFRVAEDGTYANADDDTYVLPEGARIGVVHPLEIEAATLAKWRERFDEYQLIQPFPQIVRQAVRVSLEEAQRFVEVDSLKLLGLERRGWRRGQVGDGGVVWQLEKEAGVLRASLTIEPGLYAGDPKMNPTQTPRDLDFTSATSGPVDPPDPIFLAEVAADLRAVGALAG